MWHRPGLKTPLTVAGEDHTHAGQDGFEVDPGRPFHRCQQQLARLQRKWDRQVRANNPQCFDSAGVWKKGCRIEQVSKGMQETRLRINKLYTRGANIRREVYQLAVDNILAQYDTIYLGDWKDQTPEQKGRKRRERKKGRAAAERTRNRVSLDNAPSLFRQILTEKAKRSIVTKQVIVVPEPGTTRMCPHCHEMTGPTGVAGLSVREWTCSGCGAQHKRDRASAWNIVQAGRKMSRSAGGDCPDAPKAKSRKATGPGTGRRKAPTARPQYDRVLDPRSSGKVVPPSRTPLASDARAAISGSYPAMGDAMDAEAMQMLAIPIEGNLNIFMQLGNTGLA